MKPRPESSAPGARALAAAARVVAAVAHEGRSTEAIFAGDARAPDRAAVRAIALGTLRWYLRLLPAIETLVARPAGLSPLLRSLLVAAAHQIEYSRNAPEVSVHLAVDAARLLDEGRASGLVNAVMRRWVRERAALLAEVDRDPAARLAVPAWLWAELAAQWDAATAEAVLAASNLHPPMTLRIDRGSAVDYVAELAAAGRPARLIAGYPQAVMLEHAMPVAKLRGFAAGRVSVQDAGAQLAAPALAATRGMRVLDACAAPGGKTCHVLELGSGQIDLIAVDIDRQRLSRVSENLERLGRRARCVQADLTIFNSAGGPSAEDWSRAQSYDRVLLDAPCTGTGVIRRHPDIKLLRRAEDAASFAATQSQLLRQCFAALKPSGRLLYVTCSLLDTENDGVISDFLRQEPAASLAEWEGPSPAPVAARRTGFGWQLLPGSHAENDGFYYAALTRVAKAQHS
jgi:16S rRNA (cytosine967-C5)-methyltransferase